MEKEIKKESRKKFLKVLGAGLLAIPLLSSLAKADMFLRRENGTSINFDDIKAVPDVSSNFTIVDPNTIYNLDDEIIIIDEVQADLTIKLFRAAIKEDRATELEMDLYFCDDSSNMATGRTLIGAVDIANGVIDTTSFNDATIPTGSCIFLVINSEPAEGLAQIACMLKYTYDE